VSVSHASLVPPTTRRAAVFAKIVRIIAESETGLPSKSRGVVAIYPGSFDPITNGHLDLIQRGSRLFDRLIVSVLRNESKAPLFSAAERMEMLREVLQVYPNVEVDSFDGLLVEYAAGRSATVVLRGIRAISDYEYELQMALMNRRLRPQLETVFLLANEAYSFISSRLVKQVFGLGGNISGLVPASVEARMRRRMSKRKISKRKRKGI
jgi:pantetheine-phosphate adenylyltransferase